MHYKEETKIMKNHELDLTNSKCHACGNSLIRDIKAQTEKCIHPSCLIRNVNFTIPYKELDNEIK